MFVAIVKERTKMEIIEKKGKKYFEIEDIETFFKLNEYPKTIKEWEQISNFKGTCKNFSIENGQFFYKRQRVVVMAKQQQLEITKDVHKGAGQSMHSKAMASHIGRDLTSSKISERFF